MAYGFGESAMNGPMVKIDPIQNRIGIYSGTFRPLCEGKSLIAEGYHFISTLIPTLLLFSSPAHIPRLIITIPIRKPVKGMLRRWTTSDVIDKNFKFTPSLTDRYSTCAVIFKCFLIRVCTATPHTLKNFIFRYVRKPVSSVSRSESYPYSNNHNSY